MNNSQSQKRDLAKAKWPRALLSIVCISTILSAVLTAGGCSFFGSSHIDRNAARFVVGPHAGRNSLEVLARSNAKRFVGRLAWPVKNGKVTSRFGARWGRFHTGCDISSKTGTPVRAACSGRIEYAGEDIGDFGNVLVLRCSELITVYAHLDEVEVSANEDVTQGNEIGTVGKTGNATGPHLHFETRIFSSSAKQAVAIDPQLFFP